jgi:protein SMG6
MSSRGGRDGGESQEIGMLALADTPGNGKLHHHLSLLSWEKGGEELRAVYHFVKRQAFTAMEKFLLKRTVV